ncbi:MAG: hypothetical protein RLZ51_264, partial [Pseudomonadota bacterium]
MGMGVYPNDLTLQTDGKILVAGNWYPGAYGALFALRLNTNGILDASFANNGLLTSPSDPYGDQSTNGLGLLPDGRILLVGRTYNNNPSAISSAQFISRLNPDGSSDITYDNVRTNSIASSAAYTEGNTPTVLSPNAAVFDTELFAIGHFNGASLTLSRHGGASAQDQFHASGTLAALTEGSSLIVGSTTIGTVTTNSAGTLSLTFNNNATPSLVSTALRNIAYSNSSLNPPAAITLQWSFSDGNSNNTQGTGGPLSTTASTIVNITDAPNPTTLALLGDARQGATLSAEISFAIGENGSSRTFQWKADNTPIPEATASTLSIDQSLVGRTISVTASYNDAQGVARSISSRETLAVININDLPSGAVSITGTAAQGQILTASNTITDADGLPDFGPGVISYQWRADGVEILGATGSSYTPVANDVGKALTVIARYTDLFGAAEQLASNPTSPVAPLAPPPPPPEVDHAVYHWKSHMLLSGVQVGSMSAHAGAADSSLFDLRAAAFDAATSTLTVQVWSTPVATSANFDFSVSSTGVTSASFTSALGAGWTVLPNTADPAAISVSGFDGNLTGFATATQLGTLTLQYAAGTTAMSALFSGLNVGDQSATDLNLSIMGQVTDSDGLFSLPDDGPATTAIKVSRATSDTGNAVTSADALAALRMAVGINPNADPDGAGPLLPLRTSPYQFMAADANGSGTVTSADALAILRMAVKLADALPNEWFFVEENRDFWNEVTQQYTLTRTAAA